jgi:hypothetical protein
MELKLNVGVKGFLFVLILFFGVQQNSYAAHYPARGKGFATLTTLIDFPSTIMVGTEAIGEYTLKNEAHGPLKFVDQSDTPTGTVKLTGSEYCADPVVLAAGGSCIVGYKLPAQSTPTTMVVNVKMHISGTDVSVTKRNLQVNVVNSVPTNLTLSLSDIRLFKDHTKYVDVTNNSSSVIANNVKFNLTSIPSGIIENAETCLSILPGAICRMNIIAVAGSTLSKTPISIQGANTNPAAANLTIINDDEIQITPPTITTAGNTPVTVNNIDSVIAHITSMILGSGIHNVITSLSTLDINPDSSNTFNLVSNNASYGSANLNVTYGVQTGSFSKNVLVTVGNTTLSLLDTYQVPIVGNVILPYGIQTLFYYKDTGPFDWRNSGLSLSSTSDINFAGTNNCTGTVFPNAVCYFSLNTTVSANPDDTVILFATGDNANDNRTLKIAELTVTPTSMYLYNDHRTYYVDVTNKSPTRTANNVTFNTTAISSSIESTTTNNIPASGTGRITITSKPGASLATTSINVQGDNTYPTAININISSGDEITIIPSSATISTPGNTTVNITDNGALTAHIKSIVFGGGLHSSLTTNRSDFVISSGSTEAFNIIATNASYGSDNGTITYSTYTQNDTDVTKNIPVTVGNTTVNLLDYEGDPTTTAIIAYGMISQFFYKNTGNFDWKNPGLNLSSATDVIFTGANTCTAPIAPNATCSFYLTTQVGATPGASVALNATGDNLGLDSRTIIVAGDHLTFTTDNDAADLHLSYRAVKVTNTNSSDVIIGTLNIDIEPPLDTQIYYCNNTDTNCVYKTDTNCLNGGTLTPGSNCRLWFKALDYAAPTTLSGRIDFLANVNVNIGGVLTPYYEEGYVTVAYTEDLYAGGGFTTPGNRVAKWNGTSWSALGTGVGGQVLGLAVVNGDLYVGGVFTTPTTRVAKWNGSVWSALGSGVSAAVRSLGSILGNLYASGDFTTAGGGAANRIAKWNGTSWSALGTGFSSGIAYALGGSPTTNELYVGGTFAGNISKFNNSTNTWATVGGGDGAGAGVIALTFDTSGNLYVDGFATTGNNTHAAQWNGTSWTLFPTIINTGSSNMLNSMAFFKGKWYVGGGLNGTNSTSGITYNGVAVAEFYSNGTFNRWDNGSNYCGNLPGGVTYALATSYDGNYLYAGSSAVGARYCYYNSSNSGYQQWQNVAGVNNPTDIFAFVIAPSLVITTGT